MLVRLEQCFRFPAIEPPVNCEGFYFLASFDHHLQTISKLKLALCSDVILDHLFQAVQQNIRMLNKIESDDSEIARRIFRFLNQRCDESVLRLRDAETPRIRDFLHSDTRIFPFHHRREIDVKYCIAENNKNWVLRNCMSREINRVSQPKAFFLFHKIDADGVVTVSYTHL